MRKTKIICTLGPVSENPQILKKLLEQGANVIRLNFSHGDHEEHGRRIALIKQYRDELKLPVAILLDTKGPEIRLGKFKNKRVELQEGQIFVLTTEELPGDESKVSISYKGITRDVSRGDRILLDDGLIELKVLEVGQEDVVCQVMNSGEVSDHKGVNVPGVALNIPSITEKDIEDIKFGIENDIDYIAASFSRKPSDILAIRKILEDFNGSHIGIIAKIENRQGIENIDDIIKVADGIMIARGDLGVEIPAEDVPVVQKMVIDKCIKAGKPVITATQMLESMIRNPRPTRAEVSDVANAIYDGTDAIMLSGETAAGRYPVEALKIMSKIAERVEASVDYKKAFESRHTDSAVTVTNAIGHATCSIAHDLGAAAIITATNTGYTARMVAKYRPACHIIATTTSKSTYRKLALIWGVTPYVTEIMEGTDSMIENSTKIAVETGIVKNGDLVVITAGIPVGVSGSTNLIKVHIVGDILIKGLGVGTKPAYGKVCVVGDAGEAQAKFQEGDILVVKASDNSFMPFLKKAAGIIAEESGVTSHAAIVGLSLEIPTVVGAEEATEILKDGMFVTIDPIRGFVYNGEAKVV